MNVLINSISKLALRWGETTFEAGLWEEVVETSQQLDFNRAWKWNPTSEEFVAVGESSPVPTIQTIIFQNDGSLVYDEAGQILVHEE